MVFMVMPNETTCVHSDTVVVKWGGVLASCKPGRAGVGRGCIIWSTVALCTLIVYALPTHDCLLTNLHAYPMHAAPEVVISRNHSRCIIVISAVFMRAIPAEVFVVSLC